MLAADRVNICASAFVGLLPIFATFESHTNSELALLEWVGWQRCYARILPAPQDSFKATQKFITAAEQTGVLGGNDVGKLGDCQPHRRFAHIVSHLQCLNQKLGLDDSSNTGLEIERVVTTSAFPADAATHRVGFSKPIRIAPSH